MLKKLWHRCRPDLVAINDQYHTSYTSGTKQYHQMRFYRCECGNRSFKTDFDSRYNTHTGIEKAKQNWLEVGVVPENSYHPSNSKYYININDIEKEKLDPVIAYQKTLEDIQKSLSVVLNRDFNLELKYPELKKAADEYHRKLEKYKNFEYLKGGK